VVAKRLIPMLHVLGRCVCRAFTLLGAIGGYCCGDMRNSDVSLFILVTGGGACFSISDWSENEGMLDTAEDKEMVGMFLSSFASDF
jgi:hypothetical protein